MENMTHCRVHPERPTEYVCLCPACRNLPLCETCKWKHEIGTRHATENCKEVGLAIMHQRIQDANGRQVEELAKALKTALKELEIELLREIGMFQLSCILTEELRDMKKLDTEGRYAELYFYAKTLPEGGERNKVAMRGLNKRIVEMIDTASDGLKKVLNKFSAEAAAAAAQYKPIFARYKKDEVLVMKDESYNEEEKAVTALHNTDISNRKAVYIDSSYVGGDRVVSELASRLQAHPVSALFLLGYDISDAGAEALAQAAFRNDSLSAFGIGSYEISDTGAKAVAEAARNSRSLTTLYLHVPKISDPGALAVAEAVKGCPLSAFFLTNKKISDKGAMAVAEAVKGCPLSAFFLYGYWTSDAGAIAIADAMKGCPLSAFCFGSGEISDSGVAAVAKTLSSGRCASTLSALYLGSNGFSDSGAKKVADTVRGCPMLSSFYFDSMPISGEAVAYILGSMAGACAIIRSVNLCISKISRGQMNSCLDRLGQSVVARQLKLRFECYTEDARVACEESAAEWGAKLAEFSIVSDIENLFINEVIIGVHALSSA